MNSQRSMSFVAGALVAVFAWSLASPPSLAAGPVPAMTPQPLRNAAEARAATADLRRSLVTQASTPAPDAVPEKPFFKTGKGITAAVLMTAGLAWLFYTKSHDRVTSPANR